MPQITLEYSSNIKQSVNFPELFSLVHQNLHQVGGIHIEHCKSRAIKCKRFCVGNGDSHNAFIHLQIRLLQSPDRTEEFKQQVGQTTLELIKKYYQPSCDSHALQITVQVDDLPLSYYKYASQ